MNPKRTSRFSLVDKLLKRIELTPPSDRLILRVLFLALIFSGTWLLLSINEQNVESTPVYGGVLREGIIGTPRFANPALANTRADQDVTALVYSGLLRIDTSGALVPNLAESITVSEDGLTYNVVLRQDVYFHDGVKMTAKDVLYTIRLIQDPDLKSPIRGNWSDVTVEEIGPFELNILIEEPYAPFIENFMVGIMPEHLWGALPIEQLPFSQLNTEPVGTGPFQLQAAKRDASGLIQNYTLAAFRTNPQSPKIDSVELAFYSNEETLLLDLAQGLIDASAYISNKNLESVLKENNLQLITEPLPRVFGIFLNPNRSSALRDESARKALTTAIDRDELIDIALYGEGVPITTPVASLVGRLESGDASDIQNDGTPTERAAFILEKNGWRKNNVGLLEKQIDGSTETLSVTLRTSNAPLFNDITEVIKRQWEAIGVEVVVEQFEQTGLVQSVIRPRDFSALLFGIDMSRSEDLYPFWHSSQKDDPGLNIAQYTNLTVDALLEKARTEQDEKERITALRQASAIIAEELPAIFLFQPLMTYVVAENFIVPPITQISRPSDRFNNTAEWYTDSDELWTFFQQDI